MKAKDRSVTIFKMSKIYTGKKNNYEITQKYRDAVNRVLDVRGDGNSRTVGFGSNC